MADLPDFLGGQLTLWPVPESSEPDRAHAQRAAELGAQVLATGGTEVEAALAILNYGKQLETVGETSEREGSDLDVLSPIDKEEGDARTAFAAAHEPHS